MRIYLYNDIRILLFLRFSVIFRLWHAMCLYIYIIKHKKEIAMIVEFNLDEKDIECLESLLPGKTRSQVLRYLLMFVDKDIGKCGAHSDFVAWATKLSSAPLFTFKG